MSTCRFINNESEIILSSSWVDSPTFKTRDKIVTNEGRMYKLIEKKERSFSYIERIGRVFLGCLAYIATFGLALFSKTVRDLFFKQKEIVVFGIIYRPPPKPINKLTTSSATSRTNYHTHTTSKHSNS